MQRILLHHSVAPADVDPRLLERWAAMLPPARVERVLRMKDPSDRAASLLGIALLCDCASAAGLPWPVDGALVFPEGGKPTWTGGPDFSISHAGGHVACALAPPGVRVGLDIEPAGAAERAGLRRVATDREWQDMEAAGLGATDLWTTKEAVAKLVGTGIAGLAGVQAGPSSAVHLGREYVLARPQIAPGMHCAVAMSTVVPVSVCEVSPGQFLS